jgi:hypothetical protein
LAGEDLVPSQVRIISGPRDQSWDRYILRLIQERGFGHEREYVGIADEHRAETVRKKLRTAARHQGVSAKVFWRPCKGCKDGGPDCAYHVLYTAYDPAAAREYKNRAARQAGGRR